MCPESMSELSTWEMQNPPKKAYLLFLLLMTSLSVWQIFTKQQHKKLILKKYSAKLNLKLRPCEETFSKLTLSIIDVCLKSFFERFFWILGLNSDCFYITGKMYNMSEIKTGYIWYPDKNV